MQTAISDYNHLTHVRVLRQIQTFMCYCTVIPQFYFEFEGNFQVQAPEGLYSEGRFNGGIFALRVQGTSLSFISRQSLLSYSFTTFYTWRGLYIACEQQTHFRSSSEGEKRRPEMHLLFAGQLTYGGAYFRNFTVFNLCNQLRMSKTFTEKQSEQFVKNKIRLLRGQGTTSISNHRTDKNSKVLSASYYPASRGQGHPTTISS